MEVYSLLRVAFVTFGLSSSLMWLRNTCTKRFWFATVSTLNSVL